MHQRRQSIVETAPGSRIDHWRRAAAKVLVHVLCAVIAVPAWPASTLVQTPPFTATELPGNVFVMLDDSGSMGGHSLPMPPDISIAVSTQTVTIQGDGPDLNNVWSARSWQISRDHDWRLRAPALNPLWYNPAIRYMPWNKDGTLLPNASIGGANEVAYWGSATSRANPTQITERDPRQVMSGSVYASIRAGAGRGLLGTDMADPTLSLASGRRVTLSSPSVDFRYHKMPFDFGPALGGMTPPFNGHASIGWTSHDPASTPLDLFQRPIVSGTSSSNSGCFTSLGQCQSGVAPTPPLVTQRWQRVNCSGVTETFTSDPGPLTCHRARCGSGSWTPWSTTVPTLACPWTWTDCLGNAQTSPTNPGPISCGWRRQDCANVMGIFPTNPGALTCYRTRDCSGGAWGAWGLTDPGTPATCYQRQNCSGGTDYFSGTNPGTLSCSFQRRDCSGATQTHASNPGPLACWQRQDCAGTNQRFSVNPGQLSCGWQRQNCPGTTQSFGTDPGSLTCWQRPNCGGGMTGPTETPLSPLTCVGSGEQLVIYEPTTLTRTAWPIVRSPSSFTEWPWGGSSFSPTVRSRVETLTRTSTPPSTITPTQLARQNASETRQSWRNDLLSCPAGQALHSCTVSVPSPSVAALTPARFYTYTGSGNKGDPANYRVVQIDRARPVTTLFPVVDAASGQAVTNASSKRTDCAARTQCTLLEEAQNFANWWLYYRNRLFAAQAVMADAMSSMTLPHQQQLRLGYGRIGYTNGAYNPWRTEAGDTIGSLAAIDGFANPGALVRGVRPFIVGTPARAAFFDWLFSLSWSGWTPNREAIDSIGRYFSWADNRGPWGTTPGTNDTSPQLACRRNSAFLATDGEWTNVPSGQPLISSTGSLSTPGTPVESDNVAGPTIVGHGSNSSATFTYGPSNWPQFTGGASQSGTLTDAAVYYWNRDLRTDLPNVVRPRSSETVRDPAFWQSMNTYIVGYGLSASMDTPATREAALTGASVSWPTVDLTDTVTTGGNRVNDNLRAGLASRGNFYGARDIGQLRESILSAFETIAEAQGSAGGVAITGAGVTGSSRAFFPSYTTGQWSGTLRAYASSDLAAFAAGNDVTPAWSATAPAPASRNVLTSTARTTSTSFAAANLSTAQSAALTNPNHTAAEAVAYLRGDRSLEVGGPDGRLRKRTSVLGDFVNSSPLYMKAPNYRYAGMPSIGTSYEAFVSGLRDGTASSVYIGGNAGMFHAFDAQTGVERFGYVPRGVYPDLSRLLQPGYTHRYYVDGPVTGGHWHDGTAWRSVVVGTTGAGGASIFAIDVTNPASISASNVRWDLTKAESDDIGHVLSRGVVGRIKTGPTTYRWVYVTGNGYESVSNRAALLVIDIATGSLTTIPVGPTWTSTMGLEARNGMGGATVSYDSQRNIKGVYAGDRQGNLWRFDFSDGVPTGAKGFNGGNTALFTATGPAPASKRRPITAAPRLVLHPRGGFYVIFGTGKLYDDGDAANVDSQAIYGIWEKPDHTAAITATQVAPISMSTGAGDVRSFSLGGVDWGTRLGWSVTLSGGERVVSDPASDLGTLSIASFMPGGAGDPCVGGGTSYMYRFDYTTGEVLGTPANGVVGEITPLVAIPSGTRLQSGINLSETMRAPADDGPGNGGSAAQCTLYSTSIQGRPNVIAQNCPGMTPMRVWRQPTR
jgi:type IV pilus assembly protein PilY1